MKTKLLVTLMAAFLLISPIVNFGQAPNLGSTSSFAFFTGAGAFNNDGASVIIGDIGSYSSSPVGFPPGTVIGNIYTVGNPALVSPFFDVVSAFSNFTAGGDPLTTILENQNGTGFIYPGTYSTAGAAALNTNFTLDAKGDPNAIFVININGRLDVASLANIYLINSASWCNVYWQIDGAFQLGAGAHFVGTVIANGAISLLEGSSLLGRGLSTRHAIELHNNEVTLPLPEAAGTITGTATVCSGQQGVVFSVPEINNATDYIWTLPAGATIVAGTNTNSITVDFSETAVSGDITVSGTDACTSGAVSADFPITVNTLPEAPTVSSIKPTCYAAGSARITNYDAGYTYTFSPSGLTGGVGGVITGFTIGQAYTVTAINAALCESEASASFTIEDALDAPVQPFVSVVAATCDVAGSATITNYNADYTYTFSPSGPTAGVGGVITGFTIGQAYTVTATNAALCVSAASAPFTIEAFENPKCLIDGEVSVCPEEEGLIYSGPEGMTSYDWSIIGDASITGATDGQSVTVNVGTNCGGSTYTVYLNITDENTCISSCELIVTIKIPVFTLPVDDMMTVACVGEAVEPIPPVVIDNCGRTVEVALCNTPETKLKWAIICERTVIYTFCYTTCDGSTEYWTYTYNIEYEDFQMPANGYETISCADDLYTPTPPPIYDNCGHLLKTEGATVSTVPVDEGTVAYIWAYLDCNRKIVYWKHTFTILGINCPDETTIYLGNTEVFGLASSSTVRRAMPVTFTEAGQIQSISVYHNAGSGNVILGVYSDDKGFPSALLGVTPSTAVRTTAGWQTVSLTTPLIVTSGQKVWLAWVFQNVSNIRYERTSTPASVSSNSTWSSGMPSAFGTSYNGNFKFSVYCTYTPIAAPDVTKPDVTSFTIPANSASLVVPVSSFTATDNKAVTGFKLTETSTAPLAGDADWTTVAPTSYTFATEGTKTLYAWAKDAAGNVSTSASAQVMIPTEIGNKDIFSLASSSTVRRAMPVIFTEAGQIQSISVYHNAGSGNVILGVYSDFNGFPSSLLGVTLSTAVRTTAGWQTVTLTTPVTVTSGQKVWLAWVFQNVSNIRYERTSTPASVSSNSTWSSGIPSTFGKSYNGNFKFSVYCTYIADNTKSAVIAGEIKPVFEKADLKVYPNPFSEKLRFEFVSPESVNARIDLYDMTGRLVKTIFEQPVEGGVNYEAEFRPETIISGMYIYRMTMGETVYNGKVVFKKE